MAMNIDASVNIKADVSGQAAIDQLRKSMEGVSGSIDGMLSKFGGLKGAFAGVATSIGLMKFKDMVENIIDAGDHMNKLAQKTGVSVESLSQFKQAAELSDVALDDVAKAFGKFEVAISKANTGGKDIAAAFSVIGIKAQDLKNVGVDELLLRTADAFSKMQDGPTKARIAVELFGKAGIEMIPMLNMGSQAIEELGVKMSTDFAQRAEAFNDTLTMIKIKSKVLTSSMIGELLPTLQEIASAFLNVAKKKPDVAGFMDYVAEASRLASVGIYDLWLGLKELIDTIITGTRQIGAVASGAWDFLKDVKGGMSLSDAFKKDFAQVDKLGQDFVQRTKERAMDMKQFHDKLLKNSLVFGEGTRAEILARQRADTAPEKRVGKSFSDAPLNTANVDLYANALRDLGSQAAQLKFQSDHVKEFQERITTAKEAQVAFDNEQGKFKDLSAAQKRNLLELAKQVDDYSQELRIAIAGMNYDNATNKIQAETDAMLLNAREREKLLAGMELENAGIKKGTEEYDRLLKKRQEIIDQKYNKSRSFETGMQQAWNDYIDSATNTAEQTKRVFQNAFKGMEDAMVNFVKTGKLDFASLADSIISDLIRITIQRQILGPLMGTGKDGNNGIMGGLFSAAKAFFSANGNVMTAGGPLPLNTYANGGIATRPQLSIFGEGKTPEAYVPLPDGRSIPVSMKGGGGSNVVVNVVNNAGGAKATTQERQDSNGNRIIDVFIEQVKASIAADISRGTGTVTSALEKTYGANRAAGAY